MHTSTNPNIEVAVEYDDKRLVVGLPESLHPEDAVKFLSVLEVVYTTLSSGYSPESVHAQRVGAWETRRGKPISHTHPQEDFGQAVVPV